MGAISCPQTHYRGKKTQPMVEQRNSKCNIGRTKEEPRKLKIKKLDKSYSVGEGLVNKLHTFRIQLIQNKEKISNRFKATSIKRIS